jgi:hypothetical protein
MWTLIRLGENIRENIRISAKDSLKECASQNKLLDMRKLGIADTNTITKHCQKNGQNVWKKKLKVEYLS